MIPGGQNLSKRQTVFFTSVDPVNREHRDSNNSDLEAPRLAWYKQKKVEETSRHCVLGRQKTSGRCNWHPVRCHKPLPLLLPVVARNPKKPEKKRKHKQRRTQKARRKKEQHGAQHPEPKRNPKKARKEEKTQTKTHTKSPTEKGAARRPAPRAQKEPKKARKEEKTQTKRIQKARRKKEQHGAQHQEKEITRY